MAANQQIVDLSANLMTGIKNQLVKEKLNEFKEVAVMRGKIVPFDADQCDTFEKLWAKLFQRKHIEHGNYQFVKEVLNQIGMIEPIQDIEAVENVISEIRRNAMEHE